MQLTDNVTASSCSSPCFTSPLVGPRVAQLAGWVVNLVQLGGHGGGEKADLGRDSLLRLSP